MTDRKRPTRTLSLSPDSIKILRMLSKRLGTSESALVDISLEYLAEKLGEEEVKKYD